MPAAWPHATSRGESPTRKRLVEPDLLPKHLLCAGPRDRHEVRAGEGHVAKRPEREVTPQAPTLDLHPRDLLDVPGQQPARPSSVPQALQQIDDTVQDDVLGLRGMGSIVLGHRRHRRIHARARLPF